MDRIEAAANEIKTLDDLAREDRFLNRIDPFVKLFLTVLFIALTVSFGKYDLSGLIVMAVYPVFVFNISGLSFKAALRRLRIVLPFICLFGILNPIFDRQIMLYIGGVGISGGVISMLTMMIKASLAVLASYLLIAATPMEEICAALRRIRIPQVIVTEIMLIYRYITVLLTEAHRVTQAYEMRAPGQKGVAFKVWGPLLGQLLLRTVDRAGVVYESMQMRGFSGEFPTEKRSRDRGKDMAWLLVWTAVLVFFRAVPIAETLGRIFVK